VLPEVNVGAQLSTITGVVNYDFSNYEVLVSMAPTIVQASPLQKEITNLAGSANDLTIANFNVENLDPSDGAPKFNALASTIVTNLKAPDIINLEEIQDNNGPTNDAVVDASQTYQTLIDAIVAAGGPRYEFRQINPVDDTNGGEPGGNIRVGFLFNPARVSFVDRPGGTATTGTTVTNSSGTPTLSASPGLIDPTNPAFNASRKPLVGEFVFNGQTVFVVANHFNSKGGDQPLFGRFQPPTLTSEAQRLQQAAIVKDFVQSVLAANPNANVVVAGDLNDFEFSTPVNLVESAGLVNLIETLPANERYSYNFEGNAQTLDHMLVSSNLFKQLDGFDVVHFNSEFADQISDHDPSVARFRFNSAPTALALSTTSINENVPANTLIGNFTTTDPDPGNTFTYSLVAGAGDSGNSAFTVNSNQLQINLSPDFEMNSSYSIRVRTTDQGGLSLDSILTIAINDINEIFGDSGNNTIQGTTGVDTIFGRAGNDNLFGNGGNDIIFGEDGNDKLLGGFGNDYLDGGNGNDIIADVGGKNTIFGGAGNDTIMVGLGASLIDGGAGNDTIYLLFGEDTIVLTRGNGNDTINNYNAGSTRFNLTGGLTFNDLTIAQDGSSTLIRAGGERLASLVGVQANSVTASSFLTA
jgi:Ca2+-binding RTX toxin-like protein